MLVPYNQVTPKVIPAPSPPPPPPPPSPIQPVPSPQPVPPPPSGLPVMYYVPYKRSQTRGQIKS